MVSTALVGTSIGGSYLCRDYELRITARCLAEDLGGTTDEPFIDLAGHEIVTAFIKRRSTNPTDTKEVSPLDSGVPVFRLAYGHRHRGATWHDEANDVVWLMAYAQHEFRGQGDAFPYFKELDAADRLLPTEADYAALFRDRDARFATVVGTEASELLELARAHPGTEQRAAIGGQLGVGVSVEVVETLEEVYVAVRTHGLTQENLAILFAALFPERGFDEIETASELPTRPLEQNELGFRCLNG